MTAVKTKTDCAISNDVQSKNSKSDVMKLGRILRSVARSEKQNVCDYEILTDHEVYCLLKHAEHLPVTAATLVMLSLILGRTIANLLDANTCLALPPRNSQKSGFGFIVVDRAYASEHLLDSDENSNTSSKGYIPIPAELTEAFTEIKKAQLNDEASSNIVSSVRECLTQINRGENTRLSPARVTRHLRAYCAHHGISEVCYAAVAGKELEFHAGIHYTSHENSQILALLTKYCGYLHSLYPKQRFTFPEATESKRWGSHRVPSKEKVAAYFSTLNMLAKESMVRLDIIDAANYYLAYTVGVLQLATGHRPEHDAFGCLTAFDMKNGFVFIDDKKSGHNHRRITKLPKVAQQQLLNFLQHIQLLNKRTEFLYPEIAKGTNQILCGKTPLLCYIEEEAFKAVSPLLPPKGRLPELPGENNYYRHLLRTHFEKVGLATDLVDWFMGHEAKADHSFGRFAALENDDSDEIASSVDILLDELGISAQISPLAGY
ncbi:hypothetical protein [Neptunicella sp.]|uniref:hypothetical protein n=1 Tax=Neptunicella sp. TaxID=2125986 RepID=UPI003F6948E2